MKILYLIVSLGLIAFEITAGIGKQVGANMAVEWMNKLGVTKPFISAFGGLEVGAAGVILFSLFSKGVFNDKLVNWACLVLVVLKVLELILQIKVREPFAAMAGPTVVLLLITGFLFVRQKI